MPSPKADRMRQALGPLQKRDFSLRFLISPFLLLSKICFFPFFHFSRFLKTILALFVSGCGGDGGALQIFSHFAFFAFYPFQTRSSKGTSPANKTLVGGKHYLSFLSAIYSKE